MSIKRLIKSLTDQIKVTKIDLNEGNRMIRVGVGQHEHEWFFRIDLWVVGFRFTKS